MEKIKKIDPTTQMNSFEQQDIMENIKKMIK